MGDAEFKPAETEVIVEVEEVVTGQDECSHPILGPGNQVVDPVLLRQLRHTAPLSPGVALNVATFLGANPRNQALTDHVMVFAALSVVANPRIRPVIQKVTDLDVADMIEDGIDNQSDEGPREKPNDNFPALFALPLPSIRLALLIESRPNDADEQVLFFVIGVIPTELLSSDNPIE